VWIADRNFCTRAALIGIDHRQASFIIRAHQNLPWDGGRLVAVRRGLRAAGERDARRPVPHLPSHCGQALCAYAPWR
jgi:hypothetical protein